MWFNDGRKGGSKINLIFFGGRGLSRSSTNGVEIHTTNSQRCDRKEDFAQLFFVDKPTHRRKEDMPQKHLGHHNGGGNGGTGSSAAEQTEQVVLPALAVVAGVQARGGSVHWCSQTALSMFVF